MNKKVCIVIKLLVMSNLVYSSESTVSVWSKLCFWRTVQVKNDKDYVDFQVVTSSRSKEDVLAEKYVALWKKNCALRYNCRNLAKLWETETSEAKLDRLVKVVMMLYPYSDALEHDERAEIVKEVASILVNPDHDVRRLEFEKLCDEVLGTSDRAHALRKEYHFGATFDHIMSTPPIYISESQKREKAAVIFRDIFDTREIEPYDYERAGRDYAKVIEKLEDPYYEFNTTSLEDWTAQHIHMLCEKYPLKKRK